MSWRIEFAAEVKDRIDRFRPEVLPDVVVALRALGENIHLARPVPSGLFAGKLGYVFRVARPPLSFRFQVVLELSQDETTAYVVSFELTHERPYLDDL